MTEIKKQNEKILEAFKKGKTLGCGCGQIWTLEMIIKNHSHDENGHFWHCSCGYIISELSEFNFQLGQAFEQYYLEEIKKRKIARLRQENRMLESFIKKGEITYEL